MTPEEIRLEVERRVVEKILDHGAAIAMSRGDLQSGVNRATREIEKLFPKIQDPAPDSATPKGPRARRQTSTPATP